jgi:Flp pilus assembly protein TadG
MRTERDTRRARRSLTMPRARRFRGDDGSVIAEAALVTPFFILMLFGILEFGGAFRDDLTVANDALIGTRQAAIQGNGASADWNVIQAIKSASGAIPLSEIQFIVIYKASGPTTPVPAACLTGPVSTGANPCNWYGPTQIGETSNTNPDNWLSCASGPSSSYCPTTRSVLTGSPGPDYVGIYVRITHPWITGLFGQSINESATSITRLEPQKLS